MTLRLQPDSSGHALILESHGIGELERIHLAPDGDNTWSINYQGGIGKLLGSVQTTATSLTLTIQQGSHITTPLGPITLEPTTLSLPGYPDAPAQ